MSIDTSLMYPPFFTIDHDFNRPMAYQEQCLHGLSLTYSIDINQLKLMSHSEKKKKKKKKKRNHQRNNTIIFVWIFSKSPTWVAFIPYFFPRSDQASGIGTAHGTAWENGNNQSNQEAERLGLASTAVIVIRSMLFHISVMFFSRSAMKKFLWKIVLIFNNSSVRRKISTISQKTLFFFYHSTNREIETKRGGEQIVLAIRQNSNIAFLPLFKAPNPTWLL